MPEGFHRILERCPPLLDFLSPISGPLIFIGLTLSYFFLFYSLEKPACFRTAAYIATCAYFAGVWGFAGALLLAVWGELDRVKVG